MKRIALFFGLIILTLIQVGAQGNNPFDVRNSSLSDSTFQQESFETDSIVRITEDTLANTILNPFDVVPLQEEKVRDLPAPQELSLVTPKRPLPNWILLLYAVISMFLLVMAILINRNRFAKMMKSPFNVNELKNLMRSSHQWMDPQLYILYVLFALNITMLLILGISKGHMIEVVIGIDRWFVLAGLIVALYLGRHVFMTLFSWIFPFGDIPDTFNYSIAVTNLTIGVFLLPLVFGVQFGPSSLSGVFFNTSLAIWGLLYLLRQLKGLLLATGINGLNAFYFFLYLCAVEISPLFIGIKLINEALI